MFHPQEHHRRLSCCLCMVDNLLKHLYLYASLLCLQGHTATHHQAHRLYISWVALIQAIITLYEITACIYMRIIALSVTACLIYPLNSDVFESDCQHHAPLPSFLSLPRHSASIKVCLPNLPTWLKTGTHSLPHPHTHTDILTLTH